MRFLLLGYGSIGHKHSSILREMGHEVVTVDPNPTAGADYAQIEELGEGKGDGCRIGIGKYNGLLDCTPPDVRTGWPVSATARFIEKPLGELREGFYFIRHDEPVMMGFCYRWLPSLEAFKASLDDCRVYSLTMLAGSYLPDWHPNEDYRLRYHGTPGRGGIVLDSLPHSLYIARWLMGGLRLLGSIVRHLSNLDIVTPDMAGVLLEAFTGQPVYILVDYLRRPGGSRIEAVTSEGVKTWEFNPLEAPMMYRRQMEVWCEVCEGKRQYGYPNLRDGLAVQQILDAIEKCAYEKEVK